MISEIDTHTCVSYLSCTCCLVNFSPLDIVMDYKLSLSIELDPVTQYLVKVRAMYVSVR